MGDIVVIHFFIHFKDKEMKKAISLFILVLALGFTLPLQGQLRFGVKGGMNVSKISLSSSTFDAENRGGWFVGPMAELTIPILGLGIEAAGLYTQNKLRVEGSDATLKTVEVPVNLKWTLGLGSMLGVYIAAGPQFGFNLGERSTNFWQLKKNNTSLNIGAGVKLIRHLQLGVTYNFGLSDIAVITNHDNTIDVKQRSWQLSAAYIF